MTPVYIHKQLYYTPNTISIRKMNPKEVQIMLILPV